MAKKQMSFAEKAAKHKSHKDWKTIKYVKSERSAKSGHWRFNENFIQLASNEDIDQALARMEKEVKDLAKEMSTVEESSKELNVNVAEKETIVESTDVEQPKAASTESAEEEEVSVKADPIVKEEKTAVEQPTK